MSDCRGKDRGYRNTAGCSRSWCLTASLIAGMTLLVRGAEARAALDAEEAALDDEEGLV